jgi:hypothetical protein
VNLDDMLEREWQNQVLGLAKMMGWTYYKSFRPKKSPSGFPDLVLVRDRVLFVELKREKTKPRPSQVEWLEALEKAGAEVYTWRPSDLEQVGRVLARRERAAA